MIKFYNKKVLIIDDESIIRQLLKENISRIEDVIIEEAVSVDEAKAKLALTRYSLIITDFHLKPGTGIDILNYLKEIGCNTPTIVITGAGISEKQNSLKNGATAFISKPYDYLELIYIAKNLIKLYEASESLETAENIIEALSKAVDAKDAYTEGHSKRVAEIALSIYDKLGLKDEVDRKNLYSGCVLHDIGKIAVPDDILKSTKHPLSKEEIEIIRTHPIEGFNIVKDLVNLKDTLAIIRNHHEKLDGTGYPDCLDENNLSILVQIATIADIYDALTSNRSYRVSNSPKEAIEIMRIEANKKKISGYLLSILEIILKEKDVT